MPPSAPSKAEKVTTSAATMLDMLGKLLSQTQSTAPAKQTQPRSGTVPSVAGGPPTATGAARTFPNFVQAPMPLPATPPPPGTMQTGLEFRTPEAAKGAVASGMLANIAGAISDWKTEKVKKEHFQVENTISMLQALFQSGDSDSIAAAKSMLGDEKTIRSLDKYLTGGYPRLPVEQKKVQQPESPGASTGMEMVGQVGMAEPGKAGGPWMPTASPEAELKNRAYSAILKKFAQDPQSLTPTEQQLVGMLFGPQAAIAPEKYAQAIDIGMGIKADANTVAQIQSTTNINMRQMTQQRELFLTEQANRFKELQTELASREKVATAANASQIAQSRIAADAHLGILRGGVEWKDTLQAKLQELSETKNAQNFARGVISANKVLQGKIMASITQLQKADATQYKDQIKAMQEQYNELDSENKMHQATVTTAGASAWDEILQQVEAEKKNKNKKP